jgi:hypothetical protein
MYMQKKKKKIDGQIHGLDQDKFLAELSDDHPILIISTKGHW